MKKSITIRIPEPCHEDWQKMTPTEKGKFCSVCTKEVIDLTSKTDEELVKLLSNTKNTCGRLKKSQLNREVKLERKSGLNLAPYAASLIIPFTLLSTVEARPSNSIKSENSFTSLGIGRLSNSERIQITTTGKITDEHGKPLFNVVITVKETGKSEVSGLRGDYSIKSLDHQTLVFEKEGFLLKEVQMGLKSTVLDIEMFEAVLQNMIYGEIAIPEEISEEIMGDIIESEEIETAQHILGRIAPKDSIQEIKKDSLVTINGTVSDDTGIPLPGANVIIKGTSTGTQTDFDGNYTISAEAGQQLVFSYVGFATQEVLVANISNTINLQMDATLEGFMVVGGLVAVETGPSIKPFGQQSFNYDPERETTKAKQRQAYENEIEFKRIKQARKKAKRKLMRNKLTTLCRGIVKPAAKE